MPGSKERYTEFCQTTYVPLHLQPWWLDAVCQPGGWEAAYACNAHGAGVLPYCRRGLPLIQQPALTAYGGPWWHLAGGLPPYKRLAIEHRLLAGLIVQLPRVFFFHQTFRPEIRNILPFYWAGFQQTVRYTYMLPATGNLAGLYAGLKNTLRTDLRHAEQGLELAPADDAGIFFQLNKQSYARKGLRQPFTPEAFDRLHAALRLRGQAAGFVAVDRRSRIPQAGLFLAFDDRQASVLLAGLDPASRNPGALHSLYWQAIRFCSERGLALDFEGSMEPGIERVFRAFGGQLTPYFRVWRMGNKWLNALYR
ncbi:MAG: GNAT family N-acetyltransferase [Saprospirales bacterium]|nr:GNAT family N-acetyltransferase [Saprospirales bacterium]MBK8923517.1 GNAT family N-acetyltransferase [Saprospirales bacterium]